MFGFTDDAAVLIQSLVVDAELGEGSGLRMSVDPRRRSLAMRLAAGPDTTDGVFTRNGVRVFIARGAEARLDAVTLDAQVGAPSAFFLRDRADRVARRRSGR